jgi:hypothetical protein
MELGQVINPDYDPRKNYVYESFTEYFNNPSMVKIKDVEVYSMYMIKIYAMLGNAYRYLILFVDKDNNKIGAKKPMSSLEWTSLQTRTLQENHDIPQHIYDVRKTDTMSQKIKINTKDDQQSTYSVETFPISVTLLHTRKNNIHQYNQSGTIVSALETFQTVIKFV